MIRKRLRRLRGERGYTLVELLVVLAIFTTVVTALVALFTSGAKAELDMAPTEHTNGVLIIRSRSIAAGFHPEKMPMRLLDKSKRPPTLAELGLSDEMRAMFAEIIKKPTGALLVTGPTGSGKSTTLYAAMAEINRPEINIITVEDPVEYRLPGINQVQINVKADMASAWMPWVTR